MEKSIRICLAILISLSLLTAGCSKSPEEKRAAYLKSAEAYVAQGKYAEASIQYQNSLQIVPDDAKTLVSLGEVELKRMRADEAYKAFSRAVNVDPKNSKAHEYLASMLLLAKKFDRAEKEASTILKYEPQNRNAKEMLAQALFQTGKQQEAVRIMEGLLKSPKPEESTIMNAMQIYMGTDRTDDALALISKGSALYPASSKIRFLASTIYAFKGDAALARKWAEEAYQVDKNNIDAGISLARFYASYHMEELFAAHISELKSRFPKDPSPYLIESGIMMQKKDLDKALVLAEKAKELRDDTLSKTLVSQILMGKGDMKRAEKILTEAIEKDAKAIPPRTLLAQIYMQAGNPQKVLDTLDVLIKSIPRRPDIAVPTAQAYLMKGDLAKARDFVEKSLEEYKNNPTLHAMIAKIDFSEGKFKEALAEVEFLGKRSFTTSEMLYIGSLSALRTNEKDKAASLVELLKKASPETWQALHAQSLLALSKADKQGAYSFAEKAVNLFPQKPQALALYAGIAPGVLTKEEVIKKFTGLCSKNNTAFCHMILSRFLEASGNLNGALGQMKEAIGLESENASLYHALAGFYARNNMAQKAINEYETLVNKNPNDIRAALMLALLNQSQGKIADARKVYSYILEREPKNALAANNLSWILAESGKDSDLNEALRLAQIAKDKYPEDPRIADTLGYIYLKKKLAGNALAQFQLAIEKMPQDPTINYHLASSLVELSRNSEARKYVESALSTKFPFTERQDAQKLLARINAGPKK